jgi:hypothetical protein
MLWLYIRISGAGAIGAIESAHLIQAGLDVPFAESNEQHRVAIRSHHVRVSGARAIQQGLLSHTKASEA